MNVSINPAEWTGTAYLVGYLAVLVVVAAAVALNEVARRRRTRRRHPARPHPSKNRSTR